MFKRALEKLNSRRGGKDVKVSETTETPSFPDARISELEAAALLGGVSLEVREEILRAPKTALGLSVVEGKPAPGGFKFGGVPDVPTDFAWPGWDRVQRPLLGSHSHPYPMTFLAQIPLGSWVKDLTLDLPDEGSLLFFADIDETGLIEWDMFSPLSGSLVIYQAPQVSTAPAVAPKNATILKEGKLAPYLKTSFKEILAISSDDWEELDRARLSFDQLTALKSGLPITGVHQVGGYPRSIQDGALHEMAYSLNKDVGYAQASAEAEHWELLLQIDSDDSLDYMWGDVGTLYWGAPPGTLSERTYSDVRFTLQCS